MDNNKVQKNRENWKKKRRMRLIKSLIVIASLILAGAGVLAGLAINRENRRKAAEKAALREAIEEEEAKLAARRALIEKADYLALGYDYDGAINLLMQEENYENDSELAHAISGYVVSRSQLVAKDVTEVPHIFFHSLIVDKDRAFDESKWGSSTVAGNNAWMTTVDEFDKIISQMYENGWVLVRMRDLVTVNEDGTFSKNTNLLLPEGKKPYVLSVDDWSYAFYFPGIEYKTSTSSFVTIHVIVHSKKYTHAWLELRGYRNHVDYPLYFVDGVAESEFEFFEPPDTLTAWLYWKDNAENRYPFYDPEPEYGNYREFPITPRDDYLTVEYVLD